METKIIHCEYNNPEHIKAVLSLIDAFIHDEMGGGNPLSEKEQTDLIKGLKNNHNTIILLAQTQGVFTGLLIAFENFSTFTARPMINIHDIVVLSSQRGKGIGRSLTNALIDEAKKRNCSRITLEVSKDNIPAQNLYKDLGFRDTESGMYYWRKYLQ